MFSSILLATLWTGYPIPVMKSAQSSPTLSIQRRLNPRIYKEVALYILSIWQ
jgi:hypothetical protein